MYGEKSDLAVRTVENASTRTIGGTLSQIWRYVHYSHCIKRYIRDVIDIDTI
jgi:hypothetical protein